MSGEPRVVPATQTKRRLRRSISAVAQELASASFRGVSRTRSVVLPPSALSRRRGPVRPPVISASMASGPAWASMTSLAEAS